MSPANPDPPFRDETVAAAFAARPATQRMPLLALRALVFRTARATEGVGPLSEVLRWGQPTYLTEASRSGSMLRLDAVKDRPDRIGLFVHCQTGLIDEFRTQYGDRFAYEGRRALLLPVDEPLPEEALGHCIALALTYRHRRRSRRRAG